MQSVAAALDHADLVVQALDEPEGNLVVGMTVRGNSLPMPVDQLGKLLVRLQALPLQLSTPVLEELTSPGLAGVVPQLCERLREEVGGVQALGGRQQQLEVLSSVTGEILRMRQQCILLSLDELPVPATEPGVFLLAYPVERLAQMPQDVKLVEQNSGLRRVAIRRVAERLPHIHHGQAQLASLGFAQKSVELIHACLAAIDSPKPDRAMLLKVADHDAIVVTLAHGDLVDADDVRARIASAFELLGHVLLLETLDRVPVQTQLRGHVLDR